MTASAGMAAGPSLLDFLNSADGAALRARFQEKSMPKGALFRDQDRADRVFVVLSGRLRAYLTAEGRELSLAYLTEGEIFSTHTRAEIEAVEDTRLLLAERRMLEGELAHYPPLRAAIIRVLARVLSQAMTVIEDLAFHDVRGRIARYLLRCARRDGAAEAGQIIRVGLSMDELAALLGSTRQTASTEFNALIREDVIARKDRQHFLLRDPAKLLAAAGVAEDVS
ncbi:transcriptional regulator, Crp/Fnr family [Methylocella silvestris BL2]|uniref:Transcriptional regulator, Crp/Fnr family n=1 Tax=Methylocella silvestris (strain DSM 15510 / CIP 108128 / LMG 27833 / NCIMB 13906 / BL2) TaxID=395965 RepID=B8ER25_METSB|nr:Crp/Fnr family transcriptional regulator [Methylocella silvestris]ACK49770.1 transcriptional regulator, Crp/Fnr family [Methylocella silvestris BL2]